HKCHFPLLCKLASVAQEVEQDLPQPHGVDGERTKVLLAFDHEAVVILLRKGPRRVDDLIDQRRQIHPIGAKLKLAGFDLREVENLVDEAEKMAAGTMHPA